MSYVGGKRLRLIKDNFEAMLHDSLETLGWFDNDRRHQPVQLVAEKIDPQVEIKPNTIGIEVDDIRHREIELGSNLSENRWSIYVDIFAESESVGLHLTGDIYDILRGKFDQSIGRTDIFTVYDLTQATPSSLFYCEIEDIDVSRVSAWNRPHTKYWWTILFEIVDYSYGED